MKSLDPKEIGEKAEGLVESAKGAVKNVQAEVQGRIEAAKDAISEFREKDMSEILDGAREVVKNNPVPTILAALFIGYGIGRLFGRRSS
jgi:ElaB/YqjD/DUF883 family membrane-anchored ribosome-binding protein